MEKVRVRVRNRLSRSHVSHGGDYEEITGHPDEEMSLRLRRRISLRLH